MSQVESDYHQETEYCNRDLNASAYLMYSNFSLKRIEPVTDRYSVFVFSDPDLIAEKYINEFWNGNAQVDPKVYSSCLKDLKNQLYKQI